MSEKTRSARRFKVIFFLLIAVVVVTLAVKPDWRNVVLGQLKSLMSSGKTTVKEEAPHAHDAEQQDENLLTLSREARKNIRLKVGKLERKNYTQNISLPGIVTEIPGQSQIEVAAPMTGIVTGVSAVAGESVRSGKLLFRMRLTHEDLVSAQTNFLKNLGQLDVEMKEVKRLTSISQSGAVARKVLLEKEYEVETLEALLFAFRETLLLHGLTKQQVNEIEKTRRLLREVTISVPFLQTDYSIYNSAESFQKETRLKRLSYSKNATGEVKPLLQQGEGALVAISNPENPTGEKLRTAQFTVREIQVHKGEAVQAGATLCVLTNYSQLYLEGHAFEQDISALTNVVQQNMDLSLVFQSSTENPETLNNIKVTYLSNEVDPVTRTYHFYMKLKNRLLQSSSSSKQSRFVNWKYKPGQRAYVEVPVKLWEMKYVLPREAVVQEGSNAYLFLKEGQQYRRVEVHVLFRDTRNVVVSPASTLKEGSVVALRGAQQMYMALEREAGGDAGHHGHSH